MPPGPLANVAAGSAAAGTCQPRNTYSAAGPAPPPMSGPARSVQTGGGGAPPPPVGGRGRAGDMMGVGMAAALTGHTGQPFLGGVTSMHQGGANQADVAAREARLARQRQYARDLEQQAIEKKVRMEKEAAEREALDLKHEAEAAGYTNLGQRILRSPPPPGAPPMSGAPPLTGAHSPVRGAGMQATGMGGAPPLGGPPGGGIGVGASIGAPPGGGGYDRRPRITRNLDVIPMPAAGGGGLQPVMEATTGGGGLDEPRPHSTGSQMIPAPHPGAAGLLVPQGRYQDPVVRGWAKEEQLQRLLDWERERARERDWERQRDLEREREREDVRTREHNAALARQRAFDQRCREEEVDRAKRAERKMLDEMAALRAEFVGQHRQVVSQLEDQIAKLRHATAAATAAAQAAAYGQHHAVLAGGGAYGSPTADSDSTMPSALPTAGSRPPASGARGPSLEGSRGGTPPGGYAEAPAAQRPAARTASSGSGTAASRGASPAPRGTSAPRGAYGDAPPRGAYGMRTDATNTRASDEAAEVLDKLLYDFLQNGADLRQA